MLVALMDQSLLPNSEQIRLVGGQDQLEGRLEVFHEGQWGSVCSDRWALNAASVACKQLNLGKIFFLSVCLFVGVFILFVFEAPVVNVDSSARCACLDVCLTSCPQLVVCKHRQVCKHKLMLTIP